MVISKNGNIPPERQVKSEPSRDDAASQLFEEDEAEEREAALSSPIKGGKRVSNEVRILKDFRDLKSHGL